MTEPDAWINESDPPKWRIESVDPLPGCLPETVMLCFGNVLICHIERSNQSDKMLPKLVEVLNQNHIKI